MFQRSLSILYVTFTLILALVVSGCGQSSSSLDKNRYDSETDNNSLNQGEPDAGDESDRELQLLAVAPVSGSEFLTVDAGRDQVTDPNVLLFLNGQAESSMDDIVAIYWSQLKGTPVTIADPTSLNPAFMAPDIQHTEQLQFRLTVQDASGNTNYDTITVRVEPQSRLVTVVSVVVEESAEFAVFQVRLTPAQPTEFVADYATFNGSSINELDYETTIGTLTFAPGETLKEVRVPILSDDNGESYETFGLNVGYTIDGESYSTQGTALIYDQGSTGTAPPQDDLTGGSGIVRINLEWPSDDNDLDIHVIDPCGNEIYYSNKTAICDDKTGQLDVDNVETGVEDPIENIFWENEAPLGVYRAFVVHYRGEPTTYTARIYYGNNSQEFTGSLVEKEEVTLLEFNYMGN